MTILDECWEWKGTRGTKGYGEKRVAGKIHGTHRLAWAWANSSWDEDGPYIPFGMHVLHHCDNPPCCNPDHLFLGTNADNMADKCAKRKHFRHNQTHCKRGHEYKLYGRLRRNDGGRACIKCETEVRRDLCACGETKVIYSKRCRKCWAATPTKQLRSIANRAQSQ
jgi:hypothetical protein